MVSPQHKKRAARFLVDEQLLSVRRACRALRLSRSTFFFKKSADSDRQKRLETAINRLSQEYPRYGYRRITAMLRREGWVVSFNKVQKIRRELGLRVSQKKSKRKPSSNDKVIEGSAKYINHVWSWDFIFDATEDGRPVKIMTLVDEYTRRWLSFRAGYKLNHADVWETLNQAIAKYGYPKNVRSDNGPEFIAKKLKEKLAMSSININYIEPGSPWENSWIESFHGKLRDECLNRELFFNLTEATVILQDHRKQYNE